MLAGMTQEQTDRENWETCRRIAEELDAIAEGRIYRCPHCGELVELDFDDVAEDACPACPQCDAEIEEGDAEPYSLYEYFEDALDIEYRVGSDMKYRSVQIMVAYGGPSIYIDTGEKAVLLYWWSDRAEYDLLSDTASAIDDVFEDYFNCQ